MKTLFAILILSCAGLLAGCAKDSPDTAGSIAGAGDPVAANQSITAAATGNLFTLAARHVTTPEECTALLRQMTDEFRILAAANPVATKADAKAAADRLADPTPASYAAAVSLAGERKADADAAVSDAAAVNRRKDADADAARESKATRDGWCYAIMAGFVLGVAACGVLAFVTREPSTLANPAFVFAALGCAGMAVFCGVLPDVLDSWWTIGMVAASLVGGLVWFVRRLVNEDWTRNKTNVKEGSTNGSASAT